MSKLSHGAVRKIKNIRWDFGGRMGIDIKGLPYKVPGNLAPGLQFVVLVI